MGEVDIAVLSVQSEFLQLIFVLIFKTLCCRILSYLKYMVYYTICVSFVAAYGIKICLHKHLYI